MLCVLFYHDTVWLNVDREKMNHAVFAALKHGGVYGIVDHSAAPGTGLNGVKTVHRIDEQTLRSEVEHAGFQFVSEAAFLRNPSDTRDWNDSPKEAGRATWYVGPLRDRIQEAVTRERCAPTKARRSAAAQSSGRKP